MMKKVPYMTPEAIEQDAAALLAEYALARGVVIVPPIPIEDILEKHLKLRIEFDDTHSLFGIPPRLGTDPDILGAMLFDESRIVIDESLDPEERPAIEGRYRFTLAHEGGGHWRLHRRYFNAHLGQAGLFAGPTNPFVICRPSPAREPVEWQADYYASCLLMPRKLVVAAWREMFPDGKPRVVQPDIRVKHSFVEIELDRWKFLKEERWIEPVDVALERVVRPLAEKFLVSPIAMRIRLENLLLLLRKVPHQHLFASA
jgi:Zn-dependent peptidase ImmA (M78 family)